MADILQKIATNLFHAETEEVVELVQQALDQGMTPAEYFGKKREVEPKEKGWRCKWAEARPYRCAW